MVAKLTMACSSAARSLQVSPRQCSRSSSLLIRRASCDSATLSLPLQPEPSPESTPMLESQCQLLNDLQRGVLERAEVDRPDVLLSSMAADASPSVRLTIFFKSIT
eukprot:TRINITY_DN35822_c0_g2_i1.p1 TRINITY_DN35822_c0_g2~~TRINITY_DN35822_c0_g2_i1.p1  ORF type:complete len:106 (-),score=10.70 TRINITY_DN35822_c0_g2_i1:126-443(-)